MICDTCKGQQLHFEIDEDDEADLKSDTKTPYIKLETRGFEDNIYNKSKQRGIKWI